MMSFGIYIILRLNELKTTHRFGKGSINIIMLKEIGSLVSIFSLLILCFIFTLPVFTIINSNIDDKEEVVKYSDSDIITHWIPKSELDRSEIIISFDFTYSPLVKSYFPPLTKWTFFWARSKYFRLITTIIFSFSIILLRTFLTKELMNEINILTVFTVMIIGFLMFFSLILPHLRILNISH